jgi:hypothetical protein
MSEHPPVLDLDAQLAYFDANAQFLFERMLQEIADDRTQIIALARQRLIFGWPLYGDLGWTWTTGRLAAERREEYSDALNYGVMEAHQRNEPDPWTEYAEDEAPVIVFEADPRLVSALNGADLPDD